MRHTRDKADQREAVPKSALLPAAPLLRLDVASQATPFKMRKYFLEELLTYVRNVLLWRRFKETTVRRMKWPDPERAGDYARFRAF
jgi:hypothetical protein